MRTKKNREKREERNWNRNEKEEKEKQGRKKWRKGIGRKNKKNREGKKQKGKKQERTKNKNKNRKREGKNKDLCLCTKNKKNGSNHHLSPHSAIVSNRQQWRGPYRQVSFPLLLPCLHCSCKWIVESPLFLGRVSANPDQNTGPGLAQYH